MKSKLKMTHVATILCNDGLFDGHGSIVNALQSTSSDGAAAIRASSEGRRKGAVPRREEKPQSEQGEGQEVGYFGYLNICLCDIQAIKASMHECK